jgi:hypothetical protein
MTLCEKIRDAPDELKVAEPWIRNPRPGVEPVLAALAVAERNLDNIQKEVNRRINFFDLNFVGLGESIRETANQLVVAELPIRNHRPGVEPTLDNRANAERNLDNPQKELNRRSNFLVEQFQRAFDNVVATARELGVGQTL